ncbi:EscI/YscI/HrpB family type III secretion system inner rod protein [Vibrio parahaemolyticus]|uniref:EscI/YscI/HrpB family type III secretion system inner rod protein n=1 Tax=Vibrio parahaemolyticus TaxID=670 RepID=UPI00226B3EB8|nr:EscI/YscI/HrpB family type III secretion system inner rod protein [Vibrio parahaemolyticus]MCX8809088.1 EscI/YscI/HrpB family type III secretion system inner rod protein [Vibrio parahaemolyticus]
MFDNGILGLQGVDVTQPSVMEKTYHTVGESFEQILATIDSIGDGMSAVDALRLQQEVFHYSIYQETVTKIASKAATAVNEVMKAQ